MLSKNEATKRGKALATLCRSQLGAEWVPRVWSTCPVASTGYHYAARSTTSGVTIHEHLRGGGAKTYFSYEGAGTHYRHNDKVAASPRESYDNLIEAVEAEVAFHTKKLNRIRATDQKPKPATVVEGRPILGAHDLEDLTEDYLNGSWETATFTNH